MFKKCNTGSITRANIRNILIDYIKFHVPSPPIDSLLKNKLLDFNTTVNNATGEIQKHTAGYKGLMFTIYEQSLISPKGLLIVSGSVHKYHNNGKHNYNRFTKKDFINVINDLVRKFNLHPEKCIIKSIEIGVNIQPPVPTKEILENLIMHRKKPFKSIYTKDEGDYIQTKKQRSIIKVYDKKRHYQNFGLTDEIMRFELKYLKMIELQKQGIYNLQDLINFDFNIFKHKLLKTWYEILFYEPEIWQNTPYQYKYSNSLFWEQLKPDNFKYHLKKLSRLKTNPNALQYQIYEIMKKQIDELINTEKGYPVMKKRHTQNTQINKQVSKKVYPPLYNIRYSPCKS